MNLKQSILFLFSNIYKNKRKLLISIFFISLLVSSIFLLFFKNLGPVEHRIPGTDYISTYKPTAESILRGRGVTIEGKLATEVPPGYPMILSMIFGTSRLLRINELKLIIIFNTIVSALTGVVLFLIAELIFNKKIALITSFLWMSYPFNLWFIKNPHTEIPFIFFLYAGLLIYILALKKKNFWFVFLAGVSIGSACLIRPSGLFLPFLFVLSIFLLLKESLLRTKALMALILIIGSLVVILPWESYVFLKTGEVILLSTIWRSAIVGGLSFALLRPGGGEVVISEDVLALMKRIKTEELSSGAKVFSFLIQELTNRPVTFLKLIGLKVIRAWYATSKRWYEKEILTVQLFYLSLAFLGIVYRIKMYRDKIRDIIFLLSIIFYFWGMTILINSILRYMIPAMGLALIFSAISIEFITTNLFKKLARR